MSYFSSTTTTTGTTKPIAIRRGSSARPDATTSGSLPVGSAPKLVLQTGDAPEATAEKGSHPLRQSLVQHVLSHLPAVFGLLLLALCAL